MGIIRGALVTLITILLFGSLFLTGSFLTLSMSLNYQVIQLKVVDTLIEQTNISDQISSELEDMQDYCQNNTHYMKTFENYSIDIPCSIINQDSEETIVNYIVSSVVEKNYYKEYDCNFMDCFVQDGNPFFVFSEHSKDYFNSWFYKSLIISLVLAGLIFVFMEKRNNLFFLLGIVLIILSFLFLGIGKIVSLIIGWEFAQIVGVLFTQSYSVFMIFIISGIVLIGMGILLKFLSFGRFIERLFRRDEKVNKEDVKKEIKEAIKEEKKSKKSKK